MTRPLHRREHRSVLDVDVGQDAIEATARGCRVACPKQLPDIATTAVLGHHADVHDRSASTLVEVSALAFPDLLVEIEAIAVI